MTEDDFLSVCGHHNGHHHINHHHDMSFDDIDSISQISAMDSASQTGAGGCCSDAGYSSKFVVHKSFCSSDTNISRSASVGELAHNNNSGSSSSRRGQFPYAYIRSKLSVLPEEQAGQLSRRESMNQTGDNNNAVTATDMSSNINKPRSRSIENRNNEGDEDDFEDDFVVDNCNAITSIRMRKMALRRKRSLSVADIPTPPPAGFQDSRQHTKTKGGGGNNGRPQRGELESGYDSDTTRKSSPRGSLKHGDGLPTAGHHPGGGVAGSASSQTDFDSSSSSQGRTRSGDSDSMSSGSDDSGALSSGQKSGGNKSVESSSGDEKPKPKSTTTTTQTTNTIKKPPRKSKLPEATFKTTSKNEVMAAAAASRRFKKNGEDCNNLDNNNCGQLPLNFADNLPTALPSLTSKRFKMLRLKKSDDNGDLGIVISKKRHPQKGTTGYIIAHIDDNGLVDR